jgi:hypothetical protein
MAEEKVESSASPRKFLGVGSVALGAAAAIAAVPQSTEDTQKAEARPKL